MRSENGSNKSYYKHISDIIAMSYIENLWDTYKFRAPSTRRTNESEWYKSCIIYYIMASLKAPL